MGWDMVPKRPWYSIWDIGSSAHSISLAAARFLTLRTVLAFSAVGWHRWLMFHLWFTNAPGTLFFLFLFFFADFLLLILFYSRLFLTEWVSCTWPCWIAPLSFFFFLFLFEDISVICQVHFEFLFCPPEYFSVLLSLVSSPNLIIVVRVLSPRSLMTIWNIDGPRKDLSVSFLSQRIAFR